MSNIAIITARGGSKRIPGKNIKPFFGKPVIAYSIQAALESRIFDEVMVSTDSEEIKSTAEHYGASVPFMRSSENSSDYAVTIDVLLEVLNEYKLRGIEYDYLCCLYPTAPFITSAKLQDAFNKFLDADAQSLAAVIQYSFPPQRAFVFHEGFISYQYPQYAKTRSQDLEPIYHDCGQFYFAKVCDFMKLKTLIMPQTVPYILSEEEVQDIDTQTDWDIAEAKYGVFAKKYRM